MRWLRRISGIVWIFSWYTIYLEIFRWHHMTKSLRFNPPPPPPGTDVRPKAGAPLIAVCLGSVSPESAQTHAYYPVRRGTYSRTIGGHRRYYSGSLLFRRTP